MKKSTEKEKKITKSEHNQCDLFCVQKPKPGQILFYTFTKPKRPLSDPERTSGWIKKFFSR